MSEPAAIPPEPGPELSAGPSAPEEVWPGSRLAALPGFLYHSVGVTPWRMTAVSSGCRELTGCAPVELLAEGGSAFGALVHPADRDPIRRQIQAALERGQSFQIEYRVKLSGRGERWFRDQGGGCLDADGELVGFCGFISDCTEQRRRRLGLEAGQQGFRTLFEASPDAVGVLNAHDQLCEMNAAALRLFGCGGRIPALHLLSADLSPACQRDGRASAEVAAQQISQALERGSHAFDWLHRRLDTGETFEAQITMARVVIDGEPALLTRVEDISARRRQERWLRDLAFRDELTGLANPQTAEDWLGAHLQQEPATPLLLLALDLDRFQWFNDTFGRALSDRVLVSLGAILAAEAGPDGLAARLQSDEFLLVLPQQPGGSAEQLLEQRARALDRLRLALQQGTVDPEAGYLPFPTVSIGSTVYPLHDASLYAPGQATGPMLLQEVNTALGEARDGPIGHHVPYTPRLSEVIQEQIQLERRLSLAVDQGEFSVFYQPVVGRNGTILSAEALMRWPQAEGGYVTPDRFIPLAERNGLIRSLSQRLIEEVCATLSRWRRGGLQLADIAINVSPVQLQTMEVPLQQQLLVALERHGLAPHSLQLEITETAVLQNLEQSRQQLMALADQGFRLALDDFGTGYSSMLTLQQLPFHTLKIDKSFVGAMDHDAKSHALVQACLALARSLNLSSIAEGVESEHQCQLLMGLDCTAYQGYLFDPALPAAEFEQRLRRQQGEHRRP